MGEVSVLDELNKIIPARKNQLEQLYNLYGYDDEPFVDCAYVHGVASVGKSIVVKSLLDKLQIKHVVVNMIECYNARLLFETILNGLSGHKIDPKKGQPYARCDNMMDFLFHLRKCSQEVNLEKSVIVLDKAERFRQMDCNLLAGFLRLKELSGLPLSVIFLSEIIFESYYGKGFTIEPIKIYFPQYNRDELFSILLMDFEHVRDIALNNLNVNIDVDVFKNYLNVFLSVFYRACRDVSELRHISRSNFVMYCEPIKEEGCKVIDYMGLWRHIAPILKASLETLYLRVSTCVLKDSDDGNDDNALVKLNIPKQNPSSLTDLSQTVELPFYAKYLLIAAYLASYNSAQTDKRLFMKYHGKKHKTMRDVKAKAKVTEKLNTQLGPKPFTFDRLLAIFYAILEHKIAFNGNILVQLATLVELQLLAFASNNCTLDSPKYKCLVNYDCIQNVAKMVGFNVRKYLYDFCD